MDTGATYWPKVVLRSTVVYGSDNRTCQLAVGKSVAGFVDIKQMAYVPAFNLGLLSVSYSDKWLVHDYDEDFLQIRLCLY